MYTARGCPTSAALQTVENNRWPQLLAVSVNELMKRAAESRSTVGQSWELRSSVSPQW